MFIMKRLCIFLLAVMFAGVVFGQDTRKTVAVVPATGSAGVRQDIKDGITEGLLEGVVKSRQYRPVARDQDFANALREMKFQQSGAVADDQLIRFGRALGAALVCFATVSQFSDMEYRISYKMIDVALGEILDMSSETVRTGVSGLLDATDNIAKKLFGDGGGGRPSGGAGASGGGRNKTFTANGVTFEMVFVQGGGFTMGCTSEQGNDCYDDEKPSHRVNLSDFYIGKHEVTQQLWRAVMGENPSSFKGDNLPVENVSWNDCQTFISRLNSLTGMQFRLPTEAQWEYAARGGNQSKGFKYSGSHDPFDVAWYADNSGSRTHPVGTKAPNELGIHDMSGNVWEWCRDWYGANYYGSSPVESPTGPSSGSNRVFRGGGWYNAARSCRVSCRGNYAPEHRDNGIGLRLVVLP